MRKHRRQVEDVAALVSQRWSESEARRVLAAWRSSGMSLAGFGRTYGVSAHRLSWWRKHLSRPPDLPQLGYGYVRAMNASTDGSLRGEGIKVGVREQGRPHPNDGISLRHSRNCGPIGSGRYPLAICYRSHTRNRKHGRGDPGLRQERADIYRELLWGWVRQG